MLVKTDVLILNGQKLVQGMQVHKQLMLKIMSKGIAEYSVAFSITSPVIGKRYSG